MPDLLTLYKRQLKIAIVVFMQYRVGFFLWMLGMAIEPVVYLVVWRTVAEAQGGIVAGYTVGEFAAYYITWTLVRQMNIGLTPWAFEARVQQGTLSPMLMRPAHPFHFDLAWLTGMKVITTLVWIPTAVFLAAIFRPSFHPEWWQIAAFIASLFTGYIMRFILLWCLGLITFWITRVGAVFDLYFAAELLFSGRLVPLDLLPDWAQRWANWLPYQWSFGFPIELLIGRLTPTETVTGFMAQLGWTLLGLVILKIVWRTGVRRYSAVGA